MQNKKGFVLLETIIVLLVTMIAMISLFSTYSYVFKNLKQNDYYDNINDVYKANAFRNMLAKTSGNASFCNMGNNFVKIDKNSCNAYFRSPDCNVLMTKFEIDSIILTRVGVNELIYGYNTNNLYRLTNTDINYLEHLDLNEDYKYLVITYKKDNHNYYASLRIDSLC